MTGAQLEQIMDGILEQDPEPTMTELKSDTGVILRGIDAIIANQQTIQNALNSVINSTSDKNKDMGIPERKKIRMDCANCHDNHNAFECPQLNAAERLHQAILAGVCLNFNLRHLECRRKAACDKCQRKHLPSYH